MIEKSDGQFGVVIYSLGNFLSGQLRNYKDIGGMIEIKVEKEGQGTTAITTIQDIDFHPTFTTSKQFRNYKIYPLEEANINGLTDQESEEIINFMFKIIKDGQLIRPSYFLYVYTGPSVSSS